MKKKTIWGNHLKLDDKKKESAKANISFCAARDVASVPMADERLVVWDLWTNYAHCQMLAKQKIINNQEWQKLKQGFYEIFKLHSAGKMPFSPKFSCAISKPSSFASIFSINIPSSTKTSSRAQRTSIHCFYFFQE